MISEKGMEFVQYSNGKAHFPAKAMTQISSTSMLLASILPFATLSTVSAAFFAIQQFSQSLIYTI
jgi:hypothetical protein